MTMNFNPANFNPTNFNPVNFSPARMRTLRLAFLKSALILASFFVFLYGITVFMGLVEQAYLMFEPPRIGFFAGLLQGPVLPLLIFPTWLYVVMRAAASIWKGKLTFWF